MLSISVSQVKRRMSLTSIQEGDVVYDEECSFEVVSCRYGASGLCVSFVSLDVVRNELSDVGMLVREYVYSQCQMLCSYQGLQ